MTPILYADELPGRTVRCNGEEYLYFAGTSYLGISRNEDFGKLLEEGMRRYGYNYASSRNGNIPLRIYDQAEAYLAAFTGAPAALTVSSGLLAGQLIANQLGGKSNFLYAPQTHPALWVDGTNPAEPITWHEWTQSLPGIIAGSQADHFIILTNALDPLLAQPYDFSWIDELPVNESVTLVVDDSHGLGVTGYEGGGIYNQLSPYPNIRLIVIASLGKALGLPGGVILGSAELIQCLRKSPLFSGASPMPPAYLYAFMQGKGIYQTARRQLLKNVEYFTEPARKSKLFHFTPDYPVFYTSDYRLYEFLRTRKILISCFPYPTPESVPLTRIVLNSLHTKDDLDRLSQAIRHYQQETP